MTFDEAMQKLEALGDEKVQRLNIRNGVGDNQFGVKSGDLRSLAKEIKTDPELSRKLWESGNLDARMLAVLIAQTKSLAPQDLESMVKDASNAQLADWVNSYLVKAHPEKENLRTMWMAADDPWLARAAWSLTTERVNKQPEGLDLSALLDEIERDLAAAPEAKKWTMNFCLGSIGITSEEHRQRALAIGEQIGAYKDYPVSKGCVPPYVPVWVNEMVSRKG